MVKSQSQLTLEEFLALPDNDVAYELIDGQAVPKISPKFFHSTVQKALLILLDPWSEGRGRIEPEWAVTLKRQGKDWVPAPDLLYYTESKIKVRSHVHLTRACDRHKLSAYFAAIALLTCGIYSGFQLIAIEVVRRGTILSCPYPVVYATDRKQRQTHQVRSLVHLATAFLTVSASREEAALAKLYAIL